MLATRSLRAGLSFLGAAGGSLRAPSAKGSVNAKRTVQRPANLPIEAILLGCGIITSTPADDTGCPNRQAVRRGFRREAFRLGYPSGGLITWKNSGFSNTNLTGLSILP